MNRSTRALEGGTLLICAMLGGLGCEKETPAKATGAQEGKAMKIHDITVKTIDGKDRSLGDFKGQVLLIVNTASECGYTPQYEGLESLHKKLKDRGFSVLGFPSNDFGGQEPGSDPEIAAFCSTQFGVSFPMFSKVTVKGGGKHPLYALLTQAAPAGEVQWNFAKFLVGKDGAVVQRFDSGVVPEDPKLTGAIEKALGS